MLLHPQRAMLKTPYDSFYAASAAAYSTRRMFSAYTGPLIRVRRSSDNAEQDIYASGGGLLDSSAFTAFVGASTAYVVTWYDQSGHTKHATQATQSKQPTIVLSGMAGRPTITFTKANSTFLSASGLTTASPHSIYAVARIDSDAAIFCGLVSYGSGSDKTSTIGTNSAVPNSWWAGGVNNTLNVGPVADYQPHTLFKSVPVLSGGTTNFYVDNYNTVRNVAYNYTIANGNLTIGAYNLTAGFANASFCEVIFFLTTSVDRLALCAIGNRWIGVYDPLMFNFTPLTDYHVFMIAGQSNALGMGAGIDYAIETADNSILQWANSNAYCNTAMRARDPLWGPDLANQNLGGLGTPGVGFATAFAKLYRQNQGLDSNTGVLLVNTAYGGYGYSNTKWQTTAAHYLASVAVVNSALANGPGTTRTFKGVLWHQGEVDVTAAYSAATYQTNLLAMIDGMRSAITGASSTTPFVAGGMVPEWYAGQANGPAINAVHVALPSLRTYTGFWAGASNGYNSNTYPGGNIHYSAAGQRLNAVAAYDAYVAALANH